VNKTKVFITVDVEASIAGCFSDPERYKPLLAQPVYGKVGQAGHGLEFILATLAQHNLQATFFVESLQSRYFGMEPMSDVVTQIKAHQQDVQLHVHPCWTNFDNGVVTSTLYNDHSTGREHQEMVAIFKEASERLIELGAAAPIAVRTGSFSCGVDTFTALADLGIKYSSNISMGISPPNESKLHHENGLHQIGSVLEMPLTTFKSYSVKGGVTSRGMTVTGCSASELTSLLRQAYKQQLDYVCILTHPFEFFKKNNMQYQRICANRLTQYRLKILCEFLANNEDCFSTHHFSSLDNTTQASSSNKVILQGTYGKALLRAAENFSYDSLRTVI